MLLREGFPNIFRQRVHDATKQHLITSPDAALDASYISLGSQICLKSSFEDQTPVPLRNLSTAEACFCYGAAAAPCDIVARAANVLNAAAQAAGKLYFGNAVENGDLNDQAYLSILKNAANFDQLTPANCESRWTWELNGPS